MKKYTYIYTKASSRVFKGTYQELVNELARTGECILREKGKDYIIGIPAAGFIYEVDSENFGSPSRMIDAKPYIKSFMDKKRVTEADYRKLTLLLNTGKIDFEDIFEMYGFVGE